jgi:Arf-GAP/SH3 domain/ANK repeat/PH domain-containing protein
MKQLINNILKKVKKLDGNSICCDCSAPDPEWLVTNLGILTCIECCGIHRELGVHISKTQSIKIDRLSTSQLIVYLKFYKFDRFIEYAFILFKMARMIGNGKFNQVFEAILDKSQKLQPSSNM